MRILDLLYPKKCVGCGRGGSYICTKCRKEIRWVGGSLRYEGVVRKVIKEIKYRGAHDMVGELVEVWSRVSSPAFAGLHPGDVVTAVPMWEPKKRQRGFNQAELIAKELARRRGLPYQELLVRTRDTRPMYGLTRISRATNVAGAFGMRNTLHANTFTRVILVDDVWTTGATLDECGKVLKEAGVEKVEKLTIAR